MKMPLKIEAQTGVNSPSVLSDDALVNLNDSFPDGKFDWCRWSAESVEGVSAIRALLDSFHLVGKRIANVWTESYDFFNTKEEIEDEVFSDLVDRLGFTEEAAHADCVLVHRVARGDPAPLRSLKRTFRSRRAVDGEKYSTLPVRVEGENLKNRSSIYLSHIFP